MADKVKDYRDNVLTHLEYIKEKVDNNYSELKKINGRLRKAENSISWIYGVGATIAFFFTCLIGILFKVK